MLWLISIILDWAEFKITCTYEYMNEQNLQVAKYREDWKKQEHKVLPEIKGLKMPAIILCYTSDSLVSFSVSTLIDQ